MPALAAVLIAGICTTALVGAQTITFTQIGLIPGPANLIRVDGDHVYVAVENTLHVYDVTHLVAPRKVGSVSVSERIWGFRTVGTLAYLAADIQGLVIVDVSNPASPAVRGSVKTPGQAKNVAIVGTKAVVADHMSGVDYIDVSNAAKPSSLGSFFVDGYARDVVASGSFAYAVDSPAGLYVFDLSKAGPLEPVGSHQSGNATRVIEVTDVGGGRRVAIMPGAGGTLQLYDVSNPAAPGKLTTFKMSGGAVRVVANGRLAYVADGREGLQVVDLVDPNAPKIVGALKTASPARDVAIRDDVVFVVTGPLPTANQHPAGGEVLILREERK